MSPVDVMWDAELFAGLSDAQRADVAARAYEVRVRPGDVLFGSGDPSDFYIVVADGCVDVRYELVSAASSRGATTHRLERGQTVAWPVFVPERRLVASALAGSHATVLAFHRAEVMALMEKDAALVHVLVGNVARIAAGRLQEPGRVN